MAYESNNQHTDRYVSRVGTFRCIVLPTPTGVFSESKEGTPCIALPLEVIEDNDQHGKRITWRGWLTAGAFDYTIRALSKAFAWDGDLEAIRDQPDFFTSMECEIVTESETYNGENRVKVKWLNSINGGGGKKLDGGKLDSILATLGRKSKAIAKEAIKESGESGAAPRHSEERPAYGQATRTAAPPIEDDDIPF